MSPRTKLILTIVGVSLLVTKLAQVASAKAATSSNTAVQKAGALLPS